MSEPEDDEEAEIGGPIVITDGHAGTPFDEDPRSLSEGGAP